MTHSCAVWMLGSRCFSERIFSFGDYLFLGFYCGLLRLIFKAGGSECFLNGLGEVWAWIGRGSV